MNMQDIDVIVEIERIEKVQCEIRVDSDNLEYCGRCHYSNCRTDSCTLFNVSRKWVEVGDLIEHKRCAACVKVTAKQLKNWEEVR